MERELTVGRHSPRHADLPVAEWEDLRGVCERHGTFAWRVECAEDKDEQRDASNVCRTRLGDEVAHSRRK